MPKTSTINMAYSITKITNWQGKNGYDIVLYKALFEFLLHAKNCTWKRDKRHRYFPSV